MKSKTFTSRFFIDRNDLSSIGTNPYFILLPGYRIVLVGRENGDTLRVVITVLDRTKIIQGVRTRVVEEREFENGTLVERSLNYFAISKKNNSVFYFGEDSDSIENGRVVSHEGSWRAGVNGARPGLIMSGTVLVGARYFQEIAPPVALDRGEILSVTRTIRVPVGTFHNVLEIRDTTPLEPGVAEIKHYARGIGIIDDAGAKLVRFGFV